MRISFSASPIFSSVRVPCPRRFLKARCSLSVRFSNIVRSPQLRLGGRKPSVSTRQSGYHAVNVPMEGQRLARTFSRRGAIRFGGRYDGVAMNGHGIADVVRIAARVSDHYGYVTRAGDAKEKLVALFQA